MTGVSTAGLHLCESLSAALALATASLLVMVDWEFPLPALMEALLTWPPPPPFPAPPLLLLTEEVTAAVAGRSLGSLPFKAYGSLLQFQISRKGERERKLERERGKEREWDEIDKLF